MGKWLAKIHEKNSKSLNTELTKLTKGVSVSSSGSSVGFVSTLNGQNEKFSSLLDELHQLNQRWQKASDLEESGQFTGLSPKREERICQELRQICGRATDIWQAISEQQPELLKGAAFLYPSEQKGACNGH